jgi:hypothetical protein
VSGHSVQTTGAEAYGKAVWSWHPLLVSSRRRQFESNRVRPAINPPAMEARGIRLQGERGISRQTTAQGMPGCSGCTCMLVCALSCAHCTRDRGCSKHPAFPAPLSSGRMILQTSGATCRENADTHSVVIVREGGRSSIPETSMIEPISRGVLDTRLRGYDDPVVWRMDCFAEPVIGRAFARPVGSQ